MADNLAIVRVDKVVVLTLLHGLHELFGEPHGQIEVRELALNLLGVDEVEDIGMVDAENAHVCAAPLAALLNLLSRGVEYAHKRNRAGRHAASRADTAVAGTQTGESEAGAAAGLVNHGRILHGVKDALDGVIDRQHEAGRQLAYVSPRIHERGRVREEAAGDHELVELDGKFLGRIRGFFVVLFHLGDGRSHTPEEFFGALLVFAGSVPAAVALGKDNFCVLAQLRFWKIVRHGQHIFFIPRFFELVLALVEQSQPPSFDLHGVKAFPQPTGYHSVRKALLIHFAESLHDDVRPWVAGRLHGLLGGLGFFWLRPFSGLDGPVFLPEQSGLPLRVEKHHIPG